MPIPDRMPFIEDLAAHDKDAQNVQIRGSTLNPSELRKYKNLQSIYLFEIMQHDLEIFLPYLNVPNLKLYAIRAADLSGLGTLDRVESLNLDWDTKTTKLWDMASNTHLRSLVINDFSKLTDISQLATAITLESLQLSGGIWNKLRVDSLASIGHLQNLKHLRLANLSVSSPDPLLPLARLTQLRELDISNQFPAEEYARLSVLLPGTSCQYFQPYTKLAHPIGGKDIRVTGKGTPMLRSDVDQVRLEKIAARFANFQEKYRKSNESAVS